MTQPVLACAGGAGPDALTATLHSAGASRAVAVVPTLDEAAAAAGLAQVVPSEAWTGPLQALDRAIAEADGEPVVLAAAGTRFRRRALATAEELLARGAGLVVLTRTQREARTLRRRLRLHPHARLDAGSGVALSGAAAAALRAHGWFRPGAAWTVSEVARLGGPIRVAARTVRRPFERPAPSMSVTVLIPAHNEEAWIGQTLRSLAQQSRRPDRVVVVDDGSTDRTGAIARAAGATVLRPTRKRGQKATALNYGLARIDTDAVIVLDADTQFHRDAIKHLMSALERGADATCGAVMPLAERGIWARGRAIEYSVAMRIHKRVQRGLGAVFVLSGCISAFRTDAVPAIGGFSERTLTDDVDATWSLLTQRYRVTYTPAAISFTVEPPSWALYKAQMRRWAAALFQTLPFHVRRLHRKPALALIVTAAIWDVLTVPLFAVASAVLFALGQNTVSAAVGVWAGVALIASLVSSVSVIGLRRTLAALPASLLMMWTNLYFFVEALGREWLLGRRSLAWVKGH